MKGLILALSLCGLAAVDQVRGFQDASGSLSATFNGTRVDFDSKTGDIRSLSHLDLGQVLDNRGTTGGLVDLAYPIDAFPALRLSSGFSVARVLSDSFGAQIIWDKLGASRPSFRLPKGKVSARVLIRPAPDGKSLILSCRIDNNSDAPVPQVLFPDLRGWLPFAGVEETRIQFAAECAHPFAGPIKPRDATPFYAGRGWTLHSGQDVLRWLDYGSHRGGISVFQKRWGTPDLPPVRTQRTETDPLSLRLVWEHKTRIDPGQSWESGEFWITPHTGGWARGIVPFREFVHSVYPARPLPRHVRDGIGFQTVWMIQTAETDPSRAAFRYADLPRIARDAKEHGIDELVPWGWCTYSTMPIPIRKELGDVHNLLQAVTECRKIGVNVAPFISLQTVRNEYVSRYRIQPSTGDWTYHAELVPNFRPYYTKYWDGAEVRADNPIWRQDVKAAVQQWIDRGIDSFVWDQFRSQIVKGPRSELVSLVAELRQAARARNPESTFGGELEHWEYDGAVLDYTWLWSDYLDAAPILNVLNAPRLNCNVEDSAIVAKKAFCDGLYINAMPRRPDQPNATALISEAPSLSAALKQVAALRRRFLPYFTEGIFLGDSMLTAVPHLFIRGHQLGNRLLISVLNDGDQDDFFSVGSDLRLWLPRAGEYEVTLYDSAGRVTGVRRLSTSQWRATGRLAPADLAFFEITALLEEGRRAEFIAAGLKAGF
ncbi:MAG: hypothetical protein ACE15E_03710 [Acidobacteriota bacterium]